jgi:hypothetical protein
VYFDDSDFRLFNRSTYYRDKKVVGVFVRFSCAASRLTVALPSSRGYRHNFEVRRPTQTASRCPRRGEVYRYGPSRECCLADGSCESLTVRQSLLQRGLESSNVRLFLDYKVTSYALSLCSPRDLDRTLALRSVQLPFSMTPYPA